MSIFLARDLVSDDFVLVQADWTVGRVVDLLAHLHSDAVIIHRLDEEAEELFYLRSVDDFGGVDREMSVLNTLELHNWKAALLIDGGASIEGSNDSTIVVSDGQILGFVESNALSAQVAQSRRGGGVIRSERGEMELVNYVTLEDFESRDVVRHLEVEYQREAIVDSTIDVIVGMAGDESIGSDPATSFVAKIGDSVDLIMSTKYGLQLESTSSHKLSVSDDDTTVYCQFRLRAIKEGTGSALLLAFIDGAQVGSVRIDIQISAKGAIVEQSTVRQETDVQPSSRRQPDLMLLIYEQTIEGQKVLQFQLHGRDADLGLNMAQFGPVKLEVDPAEYFSTYFTDIEDLLPPNAPSADEVEQRMKALGANLYEGVVPVDLREKIWGIRDRIQQVLIQSTDPWVPWEMCFITGPGDEREIVEYGYLCERYEVSRWIQPTPLQPFLSLDRIGLLVTGDSGLPMAAQERNDVMALGTDGRKVEQISAKYLALTSALARGTYTSLHFTGHGLFADASDPDKTLIMLEGHESFTARDISGRVANLGKTRPFVFLNSCQAGRAAMTLAGPGGWAKALLTAGAGAFVGAHWSVLDDAALKFSKVMYEQLLAGETAPSAVRTARLAIKSAGDPTWLAYTIYSDPFARVR